MNFVRLFIPVAIGSTLLGACSSQPSPTTVKTETAVQNNAPAVEPSTTPGIIKVRRKSDDIDVELQLDVGTDNVVFVMDMPDGMTVVRDGENLTPMPASTESTPEPGGDTTDASDAETKPSSAPVNNNKVTSAIVSAQQSFYDGRYLDSLSAIESALQEDPSNAVATAIKGSIYYQLGDKKQATRLWQRALELDPGMKDVKQGLEELGQGE